MHIALKSWYAGNGSMDNLFRITLSYYHTKSLQISRKL